MAKKETLRSASALGSTKTIRSAVYQLKYMRVLEWAVVDEAVNLERFNQEKRALVNAVLRNFLRHKDEIKDILKRISAGLKKTRLIFLMLCRGFLRQRVLLCILYAPQRRKKGRK